MSMNFQIGIASAGNRQPEVGQTSESVIENRDESRELVHVRKEPSRCNCKQLKWIQRQLTKHLTSRPAIVMLIGCGLILQTMRTGFLPVSATPALGRSPTRGRLAQDVAFDELEAGSGSSGSMGAAAANGEENGYGGGSWPAEEKMKNLDAFLERLPVLSVGQKHSAKFECELSDRETNHGIQVDPSGASPEVKLVWVKLVRGKDISERLLKRGKGNNGSSSGQVRDDIKLISLNQKLITPDKRFKVHRQAAYKWTLTIDNVQPEDGNAYYLCQASAAEQSAAAAASSSSECKHTFAASRATGNLSACPPQARQRLRPEAGRGAGLATSSFVGGARLNILAPPKIVENETSPSLVLANEYESLQLKCKVLGEPQSQLMWKREDNKPFDLVGVEQRFRHESQRKPNHQIVSVDSSELVFEPFLRSHSGAYLCIASNGIQPGVSQRMNVMAVNCLRLDASAANQSDVPGRNTSEACDKPQNRSPPATISPTTTVATVTSEANGSRKLWRTSSGSRQQAESSQSKYAAKNRLLAADKRRAQPRNGQQNASSSEQGPTNGLGAGQVSIKQTSADSAAATNHGHSSQFGATHTSIRLSYLLATLCSYYVMLRFINVCM